MNPEKQGKRLAFYETIGSIFWFLMDGAWLFKCKLLALAMIIPASVFNILTFRYTPRNYNDMAITGAMNTWLAMNAVWIIADLEEIDSLIMPAKILFLVGAVLLASVSVYNPSKQIIFDAIQRFRRFRLRKP